MIRLTQSYDIGRPLHPLAVQGNYRILIAGVGIARRVAWRGSWAACPAATSAASPAGRRHAYTHCNQSYQTHHMHKHLAVIYLSAIVFHKKCEKLHKFYRFLLCLLYTINNLSWNFSFSKKPFLRSYITKPSQFPLYT